MNLPGYDAWRLSPPDKAHPIGVDDGDECNRFPEPDEDRPRNFRPRRCNGIMNLDERDGMICCDTCGEYE